MSTTMAKLSYSTGVCPYCIQAERPLKSKGVDNIEKIRSTCNLSSATS